MYDWRGKNYPCYRGIIINKFNAESKAFSHTILSGRVLFTRHNSGDVLEPERRLWICVTDNGRTFWRTCEETPEVFVNGFLLVDNSHRWSFPKSTCKTVQDIFRTEGKTQLLLFQYNISLSGKLINKFFKFIPSFKNFNLFKIKIIINYSKINFDFLVILMYFFLFFMKSLFLFSINKKIPKKMKRILRFFVYWLWT